MAQVQDILFKSFTYPKGHDLQGKKTFRQVTPKNLRLLATQKENYAKAKNKRKPDLNKDYSEPHQWEESAPPSSFEEVQMTIFTSGNVRRMFEDMYPEDGIPKTKHVSRIVEEKVILPELDGMDINQLISFGSERFPLQADFLSKQKYLNPLKANIRKFEVEKNSGGNEA